MTQAALFRYRLARSISSADAEATLLRARLALESLHGESQVLLDARHTWDESGRICVVDASSQVGKDFNRLFVGFLQREYGEGGFRVDRINVEPIATSD